jgi:hypothetical protein
MRKLLSPLVPVLFPALLLALSGCAAMPKTGSPFSESRAEPGKGLVYVYRDDAVSGEWLPTIRLAGQQDFDLPNKHYAAISLAPGKHVVRADWPRRSDLANVEAPLTVEPNQTYYVKVASETHDGAVGKAAVFYMTAKTSMRVVERDEAMKSLPQTRSAR